MPKLSKFDNEFLLRKIVKESQTTSEVIEKFGGSSTGSGNYRTFRRYVEKYEIDTNHFKKNYEGMVQATINKRVPLNEILNGLHPHISNPGRILKKRLVEEGFKKYICEECGIGDNWNNKILTLQLNHINGNNKDHRLENLQILCPNCHTQTETYGSKNLLGKSSSGKKAASNSANVGSIPTFPAKN